MKTNTETYEGPQLNAESATQLLTSPGLRMTNSVRKACRYVRQSRVKPAWNKRSGESRAVCAEPKQINFNKRIRMHSLKQLGNLFHRIPRWHRKAVRTLNRSGNPAVREALKQKISILEFMAAGVEQELHARTGLTAVVIPQ